MNGSTKFPHTQAIVLILATISTYFCKELYIDVNGKVGIDYFNLIAVYVLLHLTFSFAVSLISTTNVTCKQRLIPNASENKILYNMEFLRVVFTLEILFRHFVSVGNIWWNQGWINIVFFFILSGFFLAKTFSPNRQMLDYLKKRLIQFIPLVTLGCILDSLFVHKINLLAFLSSMFLLSGTGIFPRSTCCTVAWYVSILFWVSILYFYMLKTLKRETATLFLGFIAFFGTVAIVKLDPYGKFLGAPGDIGNIIDMQIVYGMALMAVGYFVWVIYTALNEKISPTRFQKVVFSVIELSLLIYSILFINVKYLFPSNRAIAIIVFAALIMLFALKIGYVSQFFEKKIWSKIAKYSLATYLTQGFLVWHVFPRIIRGGYYVERTQTITGCRHDAFQLHCRYMCALYC